MFKFALFFGPWPLVCHLTWQHLAAVFKGPDFTAAQSLFSAGLRRVDAAQGCFYCAVAALQSFSSVFKHFYSPF